MPASDRLERILGSSVYNFPVARENLTTIFSHELGALPDSLATLEVASFLATVIELSHNSHNRHGHLSLEIIKSRVQNYVAGRHTLQINGGKGLEVSRRVQAPVLQPLEQPCGPQKINRQYAASFSTPYSWRSPARIGVDVTRQPAGSLCL